MATAGATTQSNIVSALANNRSILVPVLILMVISTIVLPLPKYILDFLIAVNLTLAVTLLLMAMYIDSPADFSIFPSLILVTTLYRLSLNIASTRLILSQGATDGENAAGGIIQAFGSIVIAGDYIIGAVIFLLIILIQFMVISQGAVRIGEVSARFTLDALPGKQMAIDADLNAGFIDESEAREQRDKIQNEARFYGAMDGAVRFTRRDAMAGLLITFINILGGLLIGSLVYGLSIEEAAAIFTILTIGDGLVSAVPSLIIAVAGGLMVTRGASTTNLGEEFLGQFYLDYRPLAIAALMLVVFGVFLPPGRIVFFAMAVGLGYVAWRRYNQDQVEEQQAIEHEEEQKKLPPAPERVENLLPLDPLGLEVGYNLIPLVDVNQGGNILDRIKGIRRQLALELGIVVPPIRIRDNLQLEANEYTILLRGVEISRASLMMHHLLAMSPGDTNGQIEGVDTRDPAFGLPAKWIPEEEKERAQISGYTVVDTATVLSTHLTETIKANAYKLLGRQETQGLIDLVAESAPKLVEDLIPKTITIGGVQKVMQNLLRERVSVRDMHTILEVIGDYAALVKDYQQLTEYVRMSLGRAVVQPYLNKNSELSVLTLNPELENQISQSIQKGEAGSYLAMEPHSVQRFLEQLRSSVETALFPVQPVLLVSAEIRPHVAQLTERFLTGLIVLSHAEIPPNVNVINLGIVG